MRYKPVNQKIPCWERFPLRPGKILLTFDLVFYLLFHLEFYNRGVLWNRLIEIYHLICVRAYILIGSLVLEIVGGGAESAPLHCEGVLEALHCAC